MLVKQCNNGEEAVTEGFPWEFMKPEEKVYTNNVLSSHMGGHDSVKCKGTCPPSVISLFIVGLPRCDRRGTSNFGFAGTFLEQR